MSLVILSQAPRSASLSPFTFDSVQSAQRAKASLNGADIYSGCCTLKIEYAKVGLGSDCPVLGTW